MAIDIDIHDNCLTPAPYYYADTRPEDWWRHPETIGYDESSSQEPEKFRSDVEDQFKALAKKWKSETNGYSSVASMVMHPAYLEIISHGEKMIPFILRDLQVKPNHWFIALKALAKNYSPVKPEDAGNIKKMTEAWIAWGRENGYLR
ncbi:MAG: hypothetical protein ABSF51_03195 [Verrucomicrobiota bacterium]|jgi:hypothetical protein